jgi:(p)ppGpp synthase/HD superfamily hydrolase
MTLKTKPLENYPGSNEEEQKSSRFQDYCNTLANSEYDVKVIKLADRLNNMKFISNISGHEKIKRYLREAEDFYIAYSIFPPTISDFYTRMRKAYEELKNIKITA